MVDHQADDSGRAKCINTSCVVRLVGLSSVYVVLSQFAMSYSQESLPLSKADGISLELQYDDAGNAFVCDANGIWVLHCGFALVGIF